MASHTFGGKMFEFLPMKIRNCAKHDLLRCIKLEKPEKNFMPKQPSTMAPNFRFAKDTKILPALEKATKDCLAEIQQYIEKDVKSDDNLDSVAPVSKSFYQHGKSQAVYSMTTFSVNKLIRAGSYLSEFEGSK